MTPKTFVVPLDGSEFAERALPVAETLAERIGGRLVLVSAQHFGPLEPADYLAECADRHERVPVDTVATKTTYAAEAIAEVVEETDDRVVCMTTHGRGRFRWAAMGSVAEEVVRRAGRPVLLVGRHCRPDFLERSEHLLACFDGGDRGEVLVSAVREWSQLLHLDLDVAVVTHPLDVEAIEHPETVVDPIVAQFAPSDRVTPVILHGRYVAGTLADYADDLPAALVATGSHGRAGYARVAFGSVTMGLLHLSPCPVLVADIPS